MAEPDGRPTTGGGGDGARQSQVAQELEIMVSDVEVRVRTALLQVVRPVLVETANLNGRLVELEEQLKGMDKLEEQQREVHLEIGKCSDFTAVLADEQRRQELRARALEERTEDRLAGIRGQASELDRRLELVQTDLQRRAREIATVDKDNQALHDDLLVKKKEMLDVIDAFKKRVAEEREDAREKFREVDLKRESLEQSLYSEGGGISKIRRDVFELQGSVQPIPQALQELADCRDKIESLEEGQVRVFQIADECSESLRTLKADKERYEKRLREQQREEINKLLAHNASNMSTLRQDIKAELGGNAKLRQGFTDVQGVIDRTAALLSGQIDSQAKRLDALHEEISKDIEESHKRRKKDRLVLDDAIKEARQEVEAGKIDSFRAMEGLQHVNRILSLSLQSGIVTSALHVQDFADRRSEQWVALHEHEARRHPHGPCAPEELLRQGRTSRPPGATPPTINPHRCELVPAEYQPGQVAVGGAVFDRKDILLMQHKLLEKAQAALQHGPLSEAGGAHAGPAMQAGRQRKGLGLEPGAGAAVAAKYAAAEAREDGLGGRQPGGSDRQPEARGNRRSASLDPKGDAGRPPEEGRTKWQSHAATAKLPLALPSVSGAGGGKLGAKSLTAR